MMTKETFSSTIKELEEVKFVSPYRLGILMDVKPQMIYSYVRQNYIVAGLNDMGKKQISSKEAQRFVTKYYKRNH